MSAYTVLVGLNYPPANTRSNPGETLNSSSFTAKKLKELVVAGVIEVQEPLQSDLTVSASSSPESEPTSSQGPAAEPEDTTAVPTTTTGGAA